MLFVIALHVSLSGYVMMTNRSEVNASIQQPSNTLQITKLKRADDATAADEQNWTGSISDIYMSTESSTSSITTTETIPKTETSSDHVLTSVTTNSTKSENTTTERNNEYSASSTASGFPTKGNTLIETKSKASNQYDSPMSTDFSSKQNAEITTASKVSADSGLPTATQSFTNNTEATETIHKENKETTTSVINATDSFLTGSEARETASSNTKPSSVQGVLELHSQTTHETTADNNPDPIEGTTTITGGINARYTYGVPQTTLSAYHEENANDSKAATTSVNYIAAHSSDSIIAKSSFSTTAQSSLAVDEQQTSARVNYNSIKVSTESADLSRDTLRPEDITVETTDTSEDHSSSGDWKAIGVNTIQANEYSSTPDIFSSASMISQNETVSPNAGVKTLTTLTYSSSENVSLSRTLHETTDKALDDSVSSSVTTQETISTVTNIPTTNKISLPKNITFIDFVSLTTENLTHCFEENELLEFHGLSGQISFSRHINNASSQDMNCHITLNIPVGKVIYMQVSLNVSFCFHMSLVIWSSHSTYPSRMVCSGYRRIESKTNEVTMQLKYESQLGESTYADMSINFTSIPQPRLEVNFTSDTSGYIQSPRWDGKKEYPNYFDDWVRLDVPANHSVMVSFLQMKIEGARRCIYDRLTIEIENNKTVDDKLPEVVLCGLKTIPKPTVYHTTALSFHFVTDYIVQYSGFKLLFSFHHESATPAKTPSGLWNCSVPHWPHFQFHLQICNLVDDCHAGEDEANCSHLYDGCEHGSLSIGGGCYLLMEHDRKITWNDAASECLRRNSYLASLNSPEEWAEVLHFLNEIMKNSYNMYYFGLQASGPNFPEIYRRSFQWSDESTVLYFKVQPYNQDSTQDCSIFIVGNTHWYFSDSAYLRMVKCDQNLTDKFLCEKQSTHNLDPSSEDKQEIQLSSVNWSGNSSHVICPLGHVVSNFLSCDVKSECWAANEDSPSSCDTPVTPQPPSFVCNNGVERVPYTLVCDHRPDCSDNSDENFCFFPPCQRSGRFQCSNKQCVSPKERCDKVAQCLDGSDEMLCTSYYFYYSAKNFSTPRPPALVDFDRSGFVNVKRLADIGIRSNTTEASLCPETHFLCPGNWTYCMPVFVRCNGVADCPGQEDEEGCDGYRCPGFYRCRASSICIHSSHVCDGAFQCPQHDDELLCGFSCPENCTCHGLAFFCSGLFPFENYLEIRFLDGQGSGIALEDLSTSTMLVSLNVARCGLRVINYVEFPNLRRLDLSRNRISTIKAEDLGNMNKLQVLLLAGNPLTSLFRASYDQSLYLSSLVFLDLSEISIITLNITTLSIFPQLLFLNLSGCGVERLADEGFHSLTHLKYLDMKRCPMNEFPTDIFEGLLTLTEVWADNYKLCCPATLPQGFNLINCHAPSDEISSCDALLRSDFYRVILSLFTVLAVLGNLGSFVYRVFVNRVGGNLGFGAFVTHLCVSDFLMGVYLAMIGVADQLYMGTYLWNDIKWKRSTACKMAGFLSLLSSEVSAFIICLITLDRFLVLRFPFSRLHFKKKSAHVACGIAWLVGVILAGIPLLPMNSYWEFYSQNGICIPLPITRKYFAGHDYSFVVMIIINFALFLLIAAGQVFIYWSIRTNSMTVGDSTKKSNDLTIARRLITIAMSDFLCWFPIGLLGVLAISGVPIPGEVNVAVAIIILPVNSAINPFLYTINMLLERRSRAREKRIQKMVMSAMASKCAETAVDRLDDANYTKGEALDLMKSWLNNGVVSPNNMQDIITEYKEKGKP